MARSLIRTVLVCAAIFLGIALPARGHAQSVRISGLSDVDFGQISNSFNDQSLSQTICLFSSGLNGGYSVTATGIGDGGRFALASGNDRLPYELQWAGSPNQQSGFSLQPGVPVFSSTTNVLLSGCFFGLVRSASLIVVLRASETSKARAGNYSGSVAIMIAPN